MKGQNKIETHNGRIYGLDFIRTIAAILIVLYHYTSRYNSSSLILDTYRTNWVFSVEDGCLAVVTFFLLSGFLSGLFKNASPGKYLIKRVRRLYPTFLICMIITSLFCFLLFKEAFVGLKNIAFNLSMVPSIFGAKAVDGVYWTLKCEVLFYIVITILLLFGDKLKKLFLFCWVILSTACLLAIGGVFANLKLVHKTA